MSPWTMRVYNQLPGPLRSVAASMRGSYLRSWRYGPETERLVEEAHLREHWTTVQWAQWREQQLAYVLHRAATRVPYYRDQWNARRQNGDRASWDQLENWPILEKEPLRRNPRAFLADDSRSQPLFHEHTSGTTGMPLHLWWSRRTVRLWYALFEARWRRWYGVSRYDRWAIIGGQLVTPARQRKPPFWVWNAPLRQLYMSSYHLSPELVGYYVEAIRKYRVRYLFGYSSSLTALARAADGRFPVPSVAVVITNAEPVFPWQREIIERCFGCTTRETYGMAEIVAAAGECEAGVLHLWPDVGWLEVLDADGAVPEGKAGEFVSTGLLNMDMPLVRYRIGDRGAVRPSALPCTCGRALPALAIVEGRQDDVLYTRDGRPIGRLDPVFKSDMPIREAQIIQESLERLLVRVVPAPGFTSTHSEDLIVRLQARMGEITIRVEEVEAIARTDNGKFRMVINRMPKEERGRVRS